jgi:hypothetical protein
MIAAAEVALDVGNESVEGPCRIGAPVKRAAAQ